MFQLIQAPMLCCPVCGQPLPDDNTKKEMALFGVDRACWKCQQPIPKERRLTKKLTDPCYSCARRMKTPFVDCSFPRMECRLGKGERIPSGWEPKKRKK